jgi:hypothetical protein
MKKNNNKKNKIKEDRKKVSWKGERAREEEQKRYRVTK